jgi:hypothetical protein
MICEFCLQNLCRLLQRVCVCVYVRMCVCLCKDGLPSYKMHVVYFICTVLYTVYKRIPVRPQSEEKVVMAFKKLCMYHL